MMDSPTMPACERTITSPDSVPCRQLLSTSLSQLSKNLPQTTSSRATMNIYLRWLDIHRQEPSRLSEHWDNTILHWAQSLKSRGFREREVIDELMRWKDANEPQRSKNRRHLPSGKDIVDAFAEPKGKVPGTDRKRERDRYIWRPDSESQAVPMRTKKRPTADLYDGPPPKYYVCNRCNKKGHHLQVCPTNMDPAYDRPPDPDYLCEVCRVRGEHFKSLCPKNTDPFSITMKRRALGIKTPSPKSISKIVDGWEKDSARKNNTTNRERVDRDSGRLTHVSDTSNDHTPLSSPTPSSRRAKEREQKLQEIEETKKRLLEDDGYDFQELELLIATNTEKEKRGVEKDRKRARSHDSPRYRDNQSVDIDPGDEQTSKKRPRMDDSDSMQVFFEMMDTIDTTPSKAAGTGQIPQVAARDIENNLLCANDGVDCEQYEDKQRIQTPKFTSWSRKVNPDEINFSSSDTESADEMDTDDPENKPVKIYSEVVQNLMRKLPKMGEEVNKIKRRTTALDMWKKEDQRQLQLICEALPDQSPPFGLFSLEECRADDMMKRIANSQSMIAQFDGAGDDMEVDEKKLTPQRKISLMRKEAVDKVKEITSILMKDLPTFKSKDHSLYSSASSNKNPNSGDDRKDEKSNNSQESFNSMQVNAASSFLKLTEENVKSHAANSNNIKPDASIQSVSSLEVNLPGNRVAPAKKENFKLDNNALAKYAMYQVHRSRGQNRAVLGHVIAVEDLKSFGESFKLTTQIPKDVLGLLTKDPAKQKVLVERNKAQRDTVMGTRKEGKSTVSESTTQTNMQSAGASVDLSDVAGAS